jgi:hypothetical protein
MSRTSMPITGLQGSSRGGLPRVLVSLLACLAVAWPAGPVTAAPPDVNAIKADMLCNLARFVQWPDTMVAQNKGQLVVAVLGEDDLAGTIASVLSTRSVNGKPVFVRFARRVQDVRGCQIVYISNPELAHQSDVVEALRGTATLTLADLEGFASRGGMVNFAGTAPNIRFEICLTRANQAGLKMSSRLLALAHVVEAAN